jgi:hypothetical protein
MGMYGMHELPAPVRATVDTCHDSCADLGDSFIDESQKPEGRRERVLMVLSNLVLEGVL